MLNKIIMNYGELKKIISLSIKIPLKKINDNASAKKHEEWDSLGHLTILSSLDVLFDGLIGPISNISEAQSVEDILNILIENKLINS